MYMAVNFMIRAVIGMALIFAINQRDIFQHVPITSRKPVKPDSKGVPGFFAFGGKFPYLGESRRILMAVSSKTSSKTRFYYAATRRISSAAVQPSIWA